MINPELVRRLPLFAASGLVSFADKFYIIADDELSLLVTDLKGNDQFIRLWEHELPEEPKKRKKEKPDLESLFLDGNVLYAIPSFSRKNRVLGSKIEIGRKGEYLSHEEIDLEELYKKLDDKIPDLNIEGALKIGDKITLLQRGNGDKGFNAVVTMENLKGKKLEITEIELPHFEKVPLTFTDAALYENKIWFLAVAENTESTYLDGQVSAAFLGNIENGLVARLEKIDFQGKPEGLTFVDNTLYFVTDDDSRDIPSRLFRYGSIVPF